MDSSESCHGSLALVVDIVPVNLFPPSSDAADHIQTNPVSCVPVPELMVIFVVAVTTLVTYLGSTTGKTLLSLILRYADYFNVAATTQVAGNVFKPYLALLLNNAVFEFASQGKQFPRILGGAPCDLQNMRDCSFSLVFKCIAGEVISLNLQYVASSSCWLTSWAIQISDKEHVPVHACAVLDFLQENPIEHFASKLMGSRFEFQGQDACHGASSLRHPRLACEN